MPQDLNDHHFINAVAIDDPDDPLHGFHHFFVNNAGLQAFRQGVPYPVGIELVGLACELTREGPIRNAGDGKAIA